MATFRKSGAGWFTGVCVAGVRKSKTLPNKTQAKNWATEMEFELGKRSEGVSVTHRLCDIFRRYAEEVSETKKGARWEIVRLNMFERFDLAKIKLIDLRREDFEIWRDLRLKEIKGSSVNRELNLISHCLTQARRWRLMNHNPLEDLQRPKNPPPRDRLISPKEIEAILIALNYSETAKVVEQQQRVAVAFLFAIETAMRAGEICSLTHDRVDLKTRVAHLLDTKNGTARDVPLSTEAVRLLKRLKPWDESGLLFGLKSGTLSTIFKKATGLAAVEGLTFHDTRHEAITRLAKKLDVLKLARAVGHKDIKQLLTYYNESAAELAKLLV